MHIDELLWDEQSEEHIARHNVAPEELEEAVFDPSSRIFRTRSGQEGERRYLVLGLTEAGRYLFVVLDQVQGGLFYPVTARDMTDGEKRKFKSK